MKPSLFLFSSVAVFFFSFQTQAKTLHYYDTKIEAKNKNGDLMPVLTRAIGWHCTSSMTSTVVEQQADAKGRMKDISWSNSYDVRMMTEYFGQAKINKSMIINHDHLNSRMKAELSEDCSRDYEKWDPSQKKNVTETKHLYLKWNCEIDGNKMPKQVDESRQFRCGQLSTSTLGDISSFDLEALGIAAARDKSINISMKLQKVSESVFDYFGSCQGRDEKDAVVVNLSQGVAGHFGENDFVFTVSIDGGQKMKFTRSSGLLSEDIKYCPPAGKANVNVKIEAVEEDLVWNDKYNTLNDINVSRNGGKGSIALNRKSVFGKPKYDSSISVAVRKFEPPRVAPADEWTTSVGRQASTTK